MRPQGEVIYHTLEQAEEAAQEIHLQLNVKRYIQLRLTLRYGRKDIAGEGVQ